VPHTPDDPPNIPSPAVAVSSLYPKFRPVTVTDAYPLHGVFPAACDAIGASKERSAAFVPTVAPTVTNPHPAPSPMRWAASPTAGDKHATVVAELHDDVPHSADAPPTKPSPAVAVSSLYPKFRPVTVTDAYPVHGAFWNAFEATGES